MRDTFVRTLLEIAKKDERVHILTGDLGFGVLKPFWDQLPNQITNVGIAEQNMTGFATGMALEGKIVFTYSIGNFPTLRTLEQIRNDAAYHNANVKIVCVGGGFAYGALGMSHHATEDLAIMRALPNVTVLAPGDLVEAEEATKAIYKHSGTCYLRLGRGGEPRIHDHIQNFQIGKAIKICNGERVVIFTSGAIIGDVLLAQKKLKESNIYPAIYSFPTIKPIDKKVINFCSEKYDYIFTVEEHNLDCGFGSAIAEVIMDNNVKKPIFQRLAIPNQYSSIVGSQEYLKDKYKLSASEIANAIKAKVKENE